LKERNKAGSTSSYYKFLFAIIISQSFIIPNRPFLNLTQTECFVPRRLRFRVFKR